jgi:hypothetical protein
LVPEVGLDGFGQPSEDIAVLAAAGLDDREEALHEAAATGGLRAKGQFAPDYGMPERLPGGVVRRLDSFDLDGSIR